MLNYVQISTPTWNLPFCFLGSGWCLGTFHSPSTHKRSTSICLGSVKTWRIKQRLSFAKQSQPLFQISSFHYVYCLSIEVEHFWVGIWNQGVITSHSSFKSLKTNNLKKKNFKMKLNQFITFDILSHLILPLCMAI